MIWYLNGTLPIRHLALIYPSLTLWNFSIVTTILHFSNLKFGFGELVNLCCFFQIWIHSFLPPTIVSFTWFLLPRIYCNYTNVFCILWCDYAFSSFVPEHELSFHWWEKHDLFFTNSPQKSFLYIKSISNSLLVAVLLGTSP